MITFYLACLSCWFHLQLMEYDYYSPKSPPRRYPVEGFAWKRITLQNDTGQVALVFIGENYTAPLDADSTFTAGRLNVTLSAYAGFGFGEWLPHLTHSRSTVQFDVQLIDLASTSGFNRSRYSLEFFAVSDAQNVTAEVTRHATRTLDDEHTPGIFWTRELILPGFNSSMQAYMQWRPVAYSTMHRDLASSAAVNVTRVSPVAFPAKALARTALYAMYGADLDNMCVRRIEVALSATGDDGYGKTKYKAW